jgi:hypothetical protein
MFPTARPVVLPTVNVAVVVPDTHVAFVTVKDSAPTGTAISVGLAPVL